MTPDERTRALARLHKLNNQLVKNGLTVSFDLEAAEALNDEDLTEAVNQTSRALVRDTGRLQG